MTSLPLDLLLEIAACSDPVTLVRCAATCRDFRRRMTDDLTFCGRLRLRHADCFVPSLLRDCLIEQNNKGHEIELHLVDTTTADATARMLTAAEGFPPPHEPWRRPKPLASRDGLVLIREYGGELRVCDPATGHNVTLPPVPTFLERKAIYWEPYILLVGDVEGGAGAGVGRRSFQVLKTNLTLSYDDGAVLCNSTPSRRRTARGAPTLKSRILGYVASR
ncbi:hypothetical protein EJB05_10683, partial [Eragrostis curvula]